MFFYAKFRVGFNHINCNSELTNTGLLSILEEAAEMHSAKIGLGLNDFNLTGLSWALINWKLNFITRCRHGEVLTIKTWARHTSKISSYRDFEVYDSNDNLLAIATSKWVLIDIFKKSMIKIDSNLIRKI